MGAEADQADSDGVAARERALALLEATHQFPCRYALTVIAFNREPTTEAVRGVVVADIADVAEVEHRMTSSGGGKYLSHRFSVLVAAAADVLELYARVKAVDGVVMIL